jgi:hypothetical protein
VISSMVIWRSIKVYLESAKERNKIRLHVSMVAKTTFMVFCKRSFGVYSLKSLGFSLQKRRM